MKAKIKKTGEIIEVTRNKNGLYVDENCVGYSLDSLDFGNDEDEHWQDVREKAAIAAMHGLINAFPLSTDEEEIALCAVKQADALVEQLKKK